MLEGTPVSAGCGSDGVAKAGAHVGAAAEPTCCSDLLHAQWGRFKKFSGAVDTCGQQPLMGADSRFLPPDPGERAR